MFSSLFGSVTAKVILAGMVAATAATGGLAAAGALPDPVQSFFAGAAGDVGVSLPNPQASAAALAGAQQAAQKIASSVEELVQQVTTAAEKPPSFGTAAIHSATTCTQNVTALAGQLATAAGGANTLPLVQSLAERATALAQESVGCAIPSAAAVSTTTGTKKDLDAVAGTAAAKAIAAAIQGCSAPLKSAIETLVQAAITANKTPAQIQALAQDAKAVAAAAQACAQSVATALQAILASLPVSIPKLPTSTAIPGLNGLLNLVPGVTNLQPNTTPVPLPSVSAGANAQTQWWQNFLNLLPSGVNGGFGVTGTVSTSGAGAGTWSGLTGSWTTSGSWTPYQGQTQGTGGTGGSRHSH